MYNTLALYIGMKHDIIKGNKIMTSNVWHNLMAPLRTYKLAQSINTANMQQVVLLIYYQTVALRDNYL